MMTTRTDRNQTFDADGTLVSEEVVEVDITADVRRDAIVTKARAVIGRLQQIEAQAAMRPAATNLSQANTQLRGLADAVADLSRVVRHVLVLDVVPGLLTDDDAAGDLDT